MRVPGVFWIILVLAAALRLYALTSVPPALSLDEVSIGYNAYTIGTTGADEYGTKLPILLRAYDDWRPALYVYLVVPFVRLFGLGVLAVRLPALVLSMLTVATTYFVAREVIRDKTSSVPLLAELFLAISPWHIYVSRLGHEVNVGLTLTVAGILFLIRYVNDSKKAGSLILSSVCFALSLYGYQSQKVVVPIVLAAGLILFFGQLTQNRRLLVLSMGIGIVLSLPIFMASLLPQALVRLSATSAFSDATVYESAREQFVEAKLRGDVVGTLMNYPRLTSIKIFFTNYLSHFRPGWLFFGGLFESHKVPGMGLLYWWELLTIPLGVYLFMKGNVPRPMKAFIMVWFLSSPIPAAMTTQAPHALRSYTFLPLWQLFSATGIVGLIQMPQRRYRSITLVLAGGVIAWAFAVFFKNYFIEFPLLQSDSFQYPLVAATEYVKAHESQYDHVILSNQDALYQSYMFFLFYTKFDPLVYQAFGGTGSGGYAETHAIGKYTFRPITWEIDKRLRRTLLVGNTHEFPSDTGDIGEFKSLDGTVKIKAVAL